jgi:hypothetical protein
MPVPQVCAPTRTGMRARPQVCAKLDREYVHGRRCAANPNGNDSRCVPNLSLNTCAASGVHQTRSGIRARPQVCAKPEREYVQGRRCLPNPEQEYLHCRRCAPNQNGNTCTTACVRQTRTEIRVWPQVSAERDPQVCAKFEWEYVHGRRCAPTRTGMRARPQVYAKLNQEYVHCRRCAANPNGNDSRCVCQTLT